MADSKSLQKNCYLVSFFVFIFQLEHSQNYRQTLKYNKSYYYRVYHAKLDIRKRWHSASKSAKIDLKKDSKSIQAPVFCVKIL